jgi:Na+-translocating ferredoxin:NAD+ oxidoreductase subunit D
VSQNRMLLQSSPHARDRDSVRKVMYTVIIALLPAALAGTIFFGLRALLVMAVSVIACLLFEGLAVKISGKPVKETLLDGSAVITGLLVAMNLPSGLPWWMVVVGALVAVVLGKHVYGGLGNNPFNPALVARVFLLISFPTAMTAWPGTTMQDLGADVVTAATPLGVLQMEGAAVALQNISYFDLFIGNVGGCLGETSVIALLLGGIILLVRKVISWEIPVTFIATVLIFTTITWLVAPDKHINPLWHVLSGGVMLGAWFMATDMVTSPVSRKGMLLFGVGCGFFTCIIRLWAGYPEGVSFAILIMNGLVPLIDRYLAPTRFGAQQREGATA